LEQSTRIPERVEAAARNNAAWCDAVCRTHGIVGEYGPDRWTSLKRTPPLYPDAITLAPAASVPAMLDHVDRTGPGCSVKDSFATLDLTAYGFRVLFDAEWIAGDPALRDRFATDGAAWSAVTTPEVLDRWARAWGGGTDPAAPVFLPSLLALDDVRVFATFADDDVIAGFVANRAHGCVGVSNAFALDDRFDWRGCIATVGRVWPGLPIVGYESGTDLDDALAQGLVALGPLRVWASV